VRNELKANELYFWMVQKNAKERKRVRNGLIRNGLLEAATQKSA
jgi:hypothetical protein